MLTVGVFVNLLVWTDNFSTKTFQGVQILQIPYYHIHGVVLKKDMHSLTGRDDDNNADIIMEQ